MKQDLLYLKRLFSKPFRAVKAGGQTNRNYIVTLKNKKFFVRLPWESKVLDRNIEGKNILALSRNKKVQRILPRYYIYILARKNVLDPSDKRTYNVPDGTMVTEYLEGREFTMGDFKQARYQKALAHMLHALHTSGVRFVNPYNVFRDEIKKYRIAAMKHQLRKFLDENTIHKLLEIEKEAEQKIPLLESGVPAHNDFIFQNILIAKNNRLYLLDFEYAGLNIGGGIFYDLGYMFRDSFFNLPRMSPKTFKRFLSAADKVYKKKLDRSQIYWAVIAALLVGIWWGILRYSSVPRKERAYFYRYARRGVKGVFALPNELREKES